METMQAETSDFYYVAYLRLLGFNIDSARKAGNRLIFVLSKSFTKAELQKFEFESVSQISTNFYTRKCKVEPLSYRDTLKGLKNYIYDGDGHKILQGCEDGQ